MKYRTLIMEKNRKLRLIKGNKDELFIASIGELLDKVQLGMSELQIKRFVLNDVEFPTDFGKYKQAKLELWVRFQNIVNLYFDYEQTIAEIELLEAEIDELKRSGDRISLAKAKIKEVEIEKKRFNLEVIKKTVFEKLREARVFYEVYDRFKDFDKADAETIAKLEREFWEQKAKYDPTGRLKVYLGLKQGIETLALSRR